jgi:translation initiation factor 2 subunit 2
MDYDTLLKRVKENLPKKVDGGERFKMPTADSFIEGNRTMVTNLSTIANYLNRDISHLLKFLLKELATSGCVEGNRVVFTGKFPKRILDEKIASYVNTYVVCKECGSPDTKFETHERVQIMRCMACQAKRPVPKVK